MKSRIHVDARSYNIQGGTASFYVNIKDDDGYAYGAALRISIHQLARMMSEHDKNDVFILNGLLEIDLDDGVNSQYFGNDKKVLVNITYDFLGKQSKIFIDDLDNHLYEIENPPYRLADMFDNVAQHVLKKYREDEESKDVLRSKSDSEIAAFVNIVRSNKYIQQLISSEEDTKSVIKAIREAVQK